MNQFNNDILDDVRHYTESELIVTDWTSVSRNINEHLNLILLDTVALQCDITIEELKLCLDEKNHTMESITVDTLNVLHICAMNCLNDNIRSYIKLLDDAYAEVSKDYKIIPTSIIKSSESIDYFYTRVTLEFLNILKNCFVIGNRFNIDFSIELFICVALKDIQNRFNCIGDSYFNNSDGYINSIYPHIFSYISSQDEHSFLSNIKMTRDLNDYLSSITDYSTASSTYAVELNEITNENIKTSKQDKLKSFKFIKLNDTLKKYGSNLNQTVYDNKTVVSNRDKEIELALLSLCRKDKHNIILTGEAGVGKTAVVEGIAIKLNNDEVPSKLKGYNIYNLSLSKLVAGCKYRGDMEDRFEKLINAITSYKDTKLMIFIDEMHQAVTSGKTEGSDGIIELLKSHLARNEVYVIGSTTSAEYKRTLFKDKAIVRRFHRININEPDKETTISILNNCKSSYETFHNIKINDNIINHLVNLTERYITTTKFPDKAFEVLDMACVTAMYNDKRELDTIDVDSTISKISNVPINKLNNNNIDKLRKFNEKVHDEVIGQDEAIKQINKSLNLVCSGITDETKPVSSFLFVGGTGTGKTEIAKQLSNIWFKENSLIRIDMSEFSDTTSVNKMVGSPAGYVGYNDHNSIFERVRDNPYSVVLFDEIEKAHISVLDLLLQILDNGKITDSNGDEIDFHNCIVILTSNVGAVDTKLTKSVGFSNNKNNTSDIYKKALYNSFRPEFINRIDNIIVFNELTAKMYYNITKKFINQLTNRLFNLDYNIKCNDNVIKYIAEQEYDKSLGARPIKRFIKDNLEDYIASEIVNGNIVSNYHYSISYLNNKLHTRKLKEKVTV